MSDTQSTNDIALALCGIFCNSEKLKFRVKASVGFVFGHVDLLISSAS